MMLLAPAQVAPLEGSWRGTLDLKVQKLTLVLHVQEAKVTLGSPDQGALALPTEVKFLSADSLYISIPRLQLEYKGGLHEGTLEGVFSQSGLALPLKFEKSELKRNRPQTPQPPFPYQTEEVTFTTSKSHAAMAGTLTILERQGKRKMDVVLMVSGSGAQDRDETLFGHKPFLVIADALARQGIASALPTNDKTLVKEYPGLNHLFQHAETGAPAEYGQIEETIASEVVSDICRWLQNL